MGEKSLPDNGTPVVDGEHQGTTTFTTSVEAKGYDRHASSVDPMNDYDLEVDDIKNIADFLAKPMPVASGAFTTANTWGDLLYSGDLFTLLNAQTIWTNKIQGFLNMRGNVKLRLVINPTPFQAGLLRMSYFPCENQLQQEATAHVYNRKTISQLPGAYLSLKDNFVEITVPYIALLLSLRGTKLPRATISLGVRCICMFLRFSGQERVQRQLIGLCGCLLKILNSPGWFNLR